MRGRSNLVHSDRDLVRPAGDRSRRFNRGSMCGLFGSQSDPAVTRRLDRIERKLDTMMEQLGVTGSDPQVVSDVAEAAGRRMMFTAVPTLARLLKHHEEVVRTAAWRALEQIDSPDARRALA